MKPSDVYVGVVDLFAILLPGSIFTWFLEAQLHLSEMSGLKDAGTTAQWFAFLMTAYAVGHFIFLFAAQLDGLYGMYRSWRWPDTESNAYQTARRIRRERAPSSGGEDTMNTFSWAKAVLIRTCPTAYASVQRFEADSKFFRSLVVVLLLLGFGLVWVAKPAYGLVCMALAVPTFFRYAERRYKSTEWAYRYVIAQQEGDGDEAEATRE